MKHIYINLFLIFLLGISSIGTKAQYATSGVGKYTNQIFWLTWQKKAEGSVGLTGVPSEASLAATSGGSIANGSYTWTLVPNKLRVTGTVSGIQTTLPVYSYDLNYGSGTDYSKGFTNMYKGISPVGMRNTSNAGAGNHTTTLSIALHMEYSKDGGNTWTQKDGEGLVVADAESVNQYEGVGATTNGSGWEFIDYNKGNYTGNNSSYSIAISNNKKTFKCTNTGRSEDLSESAVLFARGATGLTNVSLYTSGTSNQILSLGFVLPFDYGDAPSSYGDAYAYISSFGTAGVLSNGSYSPSDVAGAYTITTPLWLGSLIPDQEPVSINSVNADGDDNNGTDDEDGVTLPTISLTSVPSKISATVNASGSLTNAKLYGWIDWNQDGDFNDAGENILSGVTPVSGNNNYNISVPTGNITSVGKRYARFRITTTSLINSDDISMDGEVEDYIIPITGYNISAKIVNDGNGVTGGITGSAISSIDALPLYAYLVNSTGSIVASQPVNNGITTFSDQNPGNYKIYVTTSPSLNVGSIASDENFTLSSLWNISGIQNGNGTLTSNIAYATVSIATGSTTENYNASIGLNQKPVAENGSYSYTYQPAINTILPLSGKLTGSDLEDQTTVASLDGKSVLITQLPTNGVLLNNNTTINSTSGITVYNPANLSFQFTNSGYKSSVFKFKYVDNNQISSDEASYTITIPYALPVTLSSFSVKKLNGSAVLSWSTSSENNNDGFYIQRSNDGDNWIQIDFTKSLASGGISNNQIDYSYTDKAPLSGVNYYQLKQVDFDGKYELSKIVTLDNDATLSNAMKLYPNPAHDVVSLSNVSTGQHYKLLDMTGRVMAAGLISSVPFPITIDKLAKGIYILVLSNDKGDKIDSQKMIKQ